MTVVSVQTARVEPSIQSRHVEGWTVTTEGILHPEIARHYIRIHPTNPGDPQPDEDPNRGLLRIANRPPGEQIEFPARDIVDAGFLELVRYGIRAPDDPLIVASLKVVDAVLKVETPYGPSWFRYNHDGYGQRPDRGPFEAWGKGRLWPLLTGERGHYELAAGRPVAPYIEALEHFAHATGLLTEQVWDEPDQPDEHLIFGGPTGAAMPLMWAHAEYLKLLRSASDGEVFDRIPHVSARYGNGAPHMLLEVWKPNRRVQGVQVGLDAPHSGAHRVQPTLERRRMADGAGHHGDHDEPGDRLRRSPDRGGSGQPHPLRLSLDGRESLGRAGLRRGNHAIANSTPPVDTPYHAPAVRALSSPGEAYGDEHHRRRCRRSAALVMEAISQCAADAHGKGCSPQKRQRGARAAPGTRRVDRSRSCATTCHRDSRSGAIPRVSSCPPGHVAMA